MSLRWIDGDEPSPREGHDRNDLGKTCRSDKQEHRRCKSGNKAKPGETLR